MLKGTKEYLDDIASRYVCSEHQKPVSVAWHTVENCYVLRCGQGEYPEEVTRQPSLIEAFKQGEEIPEPIKGKVIKGMVQRAGLPAVPSGDKFASLIPSSDLATGQALTAIQINLIKAYAQHYGLDPYRGHVVIMHGKPYIGIDGYLYHARQKDIAYKMASRPLSDTERLTYKITPDDHCWLTEVTLKETGMSFLGIGIVTKEEMTEKSKRDPSQLRSPVVATHPWQLAQKRAEWQALRRAFPIGENDKVKEE